MDRSNFERARAYALARLANDLPPGLCYHSLEHTRDDVVPAAERLADIEGVKGEALLLLRTAAYFHDLGFVEQRVDHEDAGVRIAREALPQFGYSAEQIEQIGGMIMATKLPQTVHNLLEAILADADLDNLGRDDFFERSRVLHDEFAAFEASTDPKAWNARQVKFLQEHRFFTRAARELREAKKQQNLQVLLEQQAKLNHH
jgi:uncharacterized protein